MKHNNRIQPPFWSDVTTGGTDLEQLEYAASRAVLKPVRLVSRFASIIEALPSLGPCVISTLSDSTNFAINTQPYSFYRRGVQARLFARDSTVDAQLQHWKYCYAVFPQNMSVVERQPSKITAALPKPLKVKRPGLQFFDVYGKLIFDVRLTAEASLIAFEDLVSRYASQKQHFDNQILVKAFVASPHLAVSGLTINNRDTGLPVTSALRSFKDRLKQDTPLRYSLAFMRDVRDRVTSTIRRDAMSLLLNEWRKTGAELTLSSGTGAAAQIMQSPITSFRHDREFLDVHGPLFSMRVSYANVARVQLLRHPELGCHTASLKLYNKQGATLASLIRDDSMHGIDDGQHEQDGLSSWRSAVADYLPRQLR